MDPVLITHFRQFKPQLWSETYHGVVSGPGQAFIEHADSHGLCEGITLGQHSNARALGSLFSFAGKHMGEHLRHRAVLAHLAPNLHVALAAGDTNWSVTYAIEQQVWGRTSRYRLSAMNLRCWNSV